MSDVDWRRALGALARSVAQLPDEDLAMLRDALNEEHVRRALVRTQVVVEAIGASARKAAEGIAVAFQGLRAFDESIMNEGWPDA